MWWNKPRPATAALSETPPAVTSAPAESPARKPLDTEIDVFGLTHPGKVRSENQDHFLIASLRKRMEILQTSLPEMATHPVDEERLAFLMMVADGVGGGPRGAEASRVAVEHVTQYVSHSMRCYYASDPRNEEFVAALQEAAMLSHAGVVRRAESNPDFEGMATTLTLLLGVWPWLYLLQVGDSRYYLFREGKLTQVTRDQTMAEELAAKGAMKRSDALESRWAHVLSSSIGGHQTAPVVTRIANDWRNVHLMCSDGLTKHVSNDRITECLGTMTSARQACEALLQDALDGGGSDNVTIVVGRAVAER